MASEGKTKLNFTDADTHWYYFNQWHFYDETGKLIRVKNYAEGALLEETKLQ